MNLEQQRELILSGAMYNDLTPELVHAREKAVVASNRYNSSFGQPVGARQDLLRELLGRVGQNAFLKPTFWCEFGYNISVGDNFYANFDCVMLDAGAITIGHNVLFGPRVSIYTTNHAFDPTERTAGACYAKPVIVGDNVWISGGVTINPAVTIGDNCTVGSGSVVTRSLPANSVAVGVPARIIRTVTDADRTGYTPGAAPTI